MKKIRHGADGHIMRRHWPEQEQWKKRQEAITGNRDMMRERKELGMGKTFSNSTEMCYNVCSDNQTIEDKREAAICEILSLKDEEIEEVFRLAGIPICWK